MNHKTRHIHKKNCHCSARTAMKSRVKLLQTLLMSRIVHKNVAPTSCQINSWKNAVYGERRARTINYAWAHITEQHKHKETMVFMCQKLAEKQKSNC